MKTNGKPKSSKDWLLTGVIVVALYVLSTGPAAKMESLGWVADSVLQMVYAPLNPLINTEAGGNVFGWYIFGLWRVPPPTGFK